MKITDVNILKFYKKYCMRTVFGVLLIAAAVCMIMGFVQLGRTRLAEEDALHNIFLKLEAGELHGQCHAAYIRAVGMQVFAAEKGGNQICAIAWDEDDYVYIVRMTQKYMEEKAAELDSGKTIILSGITFKFTDTDLRSMAAQQLGSYIQDEGITTDRLMDYVGPLELRCRDVDLLDMTLNVAGIWLFVIIAMIFAGGSVIKENWLAKSTFEHLDGETLSTLNRETEDAQWFPTLGMYACGTVVIGMYKGLKVVSYKDILMVFGGECKKCPVPQSNVIIMHKNGCNYEFSRVKSSNERVPEFNSLCEIIKSKNDEAYIGYDPQVYTKLRLKAQNMQ